MVKDFRISYHDGCHQKRVEKIVEADSEEQMEHENLISTFEGASVGWQALPKQTSGSFLKIGSREFGGFASYS